MLKVIEEINYEKGKKYWLYRVKHNYTSSEELIKVMAKELKTDEKQIHVLKPLHGKFTKIQYVYVNSKRIRLKTEKIKLSFGNATLIKKVDSLELKNYITHLNLMHPISTEEKIWFNYAINYFIDEFQYNFKKLDILMRKENDTPQKLVHAIFVSVIHDLFDKGKTAEILIKAVKKKDYEKLAIIKNESIKKSAKDLINENYEDVLKRLPRNLVKKYVTFFFHKQWNKVLSCALDQLTPERFKVKYKSLILFLKTKVPLIKFDDKLSIDLISNNDAINEAIAKERKRLKMFFEYFKEYYDNYERNIFVTFKELTFKENEIIYKVSSQDNFLVARSYLLVKANN